MQHASFHRHPDTAISVGQTVSGPYRPTHSFDGKYIDDGHRFYATCPRNGVIIDVGIPGWLRPADALKLYECAYFAQGDVLEFGTNRGLSASILAKALIAAGRPGTVVSMELNAANVERAKKNLNAAGVLERVDLRTGDADATCADLAAEGRRFGFAFVDHSHAYEHVASASRRLSQLLEIGALVAFHDYNDSRNTRRTAVGENASEYGVVAAVEDALDHDAFEFMGVYGCCGLFLRRA